MKCNGIFRRALAMLLAVAMLAALALPAGAVEADTGLYYEIEQIDNSAVTAERPIEQMGSLNDQNQLSGMDAQDPDELVRVSIQLEKAPTINAGFQLKGIATNASAMSYRSGLQKEQVQLQKTIERQVLNGRELDVVWNLTLAANVISANVPRSAIDQIAGLKGVKSVVEENRYEPDVVSVGGDYSADMAVSSQMTGATQAWLEGYTGAGSRVAVIDTGLDTDHQSFSAAAFEFALAQVEAEKGVSYDLLDTEDIAAVLEQLNAYKRAVENGQTLTAEELYINSKAAYGYNYVDGDLDVTHDNDDQGEHGSHVAGIAIANRYIERSGEYVDALEHVFVAGNAPDAQVLVMKVFGKEGGASDSDIMASIEDAMILGADAVNLSLGSTSAGPAAIEDPAYQEMMERVMDSGLVVVASAGNDGPWSTYTTNGYLYSDAVNQDTVGTPGSYASFMAVASVDNDGFISSSLVVDGVSMGYSESLTDNNGYAFGNMAIANLDTAPNGAGTEYDFVYIDGFGAVEDYAGIDLTGKIAVCSRGDLYYYEKANAAAELGAAALVVYNNESGLVNMDLTGYSYTMPAVFVSQRSGDAIAAAGQEQTTEDGRVYRTGKITVRASLSGNYEDSEYKTMSSFSSWGVPGDLSLKPDITAPGGNIYSVNGAVPETDQYELMSGTSMASPQVAGLAAVVKQYLKEQGLKADGLSDRALTNALLMNTAEPMFSGSGVYYPVIQQGAGLADASAAVRTPVYLTVDGMDDGMAKVELGDDAQRTGKYTFSFKLNNLTGDAYAYQLSADVFTQDVFQDEAGNSYLDHLTRGMDAEVEFVVNGEALNTPNDQTVHYDFNGDSRVTLADGQLLLDHVTLGTALAANEEYADLSGDGVVDTYDVHLFLNLYQSAVEVPANGSVTVEVTITLTDAEKVLLDEQNPNGAYVQAFVHAAPLATADGELLPKLHIPVLGFYGDWSDPSMFDVGTQITFATGEEKRSSYLDNNYGNAVGVIYGDNPYEVWYFGGNPIVPDEAYIPERNAINTERGDYFYQWSYAPVRTAAASRFTAMNTTTGEVWMDQEGGAVPAPFYYIPYGSWMETPQYYEIGLYPDLEVGEYGLLRLSLATEYHTQNGQVNWDALGDGASMEVPFTVDVETPQILEVKVDSESNVMLVTASDDQYLAGVLLYDVTGRYLLESVGTTAEAQPGDTITFEIPLDNVDGYKFIIQTSDYAANFATYEIRQTIGEPDPLPTRLAFDENFNSWSTFGKESYYWNTKEWFDSDIIVSAATAVGEYAMAVDPSGKLYVIPVDDMLDEVFVRKLDYLLTDMAYDASTDTVYGITDDALLLSVDKYTGQTRELGTVGVETNTLANDGSGTFYCLSVAAEGEGYYTNYRYDLYSFTLDENGAPGEPVLVGSPYTGYSKPDGISSMEYDPDNQIISLLARVPSYSYDYTYYYEFDPVTGESLIEGYYAPMPFTKAATGLIFPRWGEEWGEWVAPTDQPAQVSFAKDEVEVLLDLTAQVSATVLPWNLTNKGLVFTSADESIATVDVDGVVTGVGLGTTTIRATSVLDETVYDECTVNVKKLEVNVNGILQDELGTPKFYTWDMASDAGLTIGSALNNPAMAVTRVPGTDTFYLLDSTHGTMHLMDNEGNDLIEPTDTYYQQNFWIWDLAYSEHFSTEETPAVFGIRENAVIAPTDPMNPNFINFNMGKYGVSFLAGIASGGYEKITYQDWYGYENEADSEIIYMIDDGGSVWRCNMFLEYADSYDMVVSRISSDLDIRFPVNFSGRSALVVGDDGALYFSAWVGDTNELYRLVYDDLSETYLSTYLGSFGENVWPVTILDVTSNAPEAQSAPQGTMRYHDSAPAGSLDAIRVEAEESEQSAGVQVDAANGTITVPVVASDSTNGLFHVDYDADTLTLVGVTAGNVMNSIDTAVEGTVRMGYADADVINSTVATLVFSYAHAEEERNTDLTITTLEDGDNAPESQETVTVEIPAHAYELTDSKAPTCTEDGYNVWTCACGESYTETVEAAGHEYESVVVDPSETEQGYTEHTCKHCGHTYRDSYTDPVPGETNPEETEPSVPETSKPAGENDSADTGDHAPIMTMILMLTLSAMVLVVLAPKFRKEN